MVSESPTINNGYSVPPQQLSSEHSVPPQQLPSGNEETKGKPRGTAKRLPALLKVSEASADNLQAVAASNLELGSCYYDSALQQANKSFISALIAAAIGLILFVLSVLFLMLHGEGSQIAAIGGALIEVISGINFYLYIRASKQLESFHICLARTELLLLANSVCKQMHNRDKQDEVYTNIIQNIGNLAIIITTQQPPASPQGGNNQ